MALAEAAEEAPGCSPLGTQGGHQGKHGASRDMWAIMRQAGLSLALKS